MAPTRARATIKWGAFYFDLTRTMQLPFVSVMGGLFGGLERDNGQVESKR